jgi:hypothetical protein
MLTMQRFFVLRTLLNRLRAAALVPLAVFVALLTSGRPALADQQSTLDAASGRDSQVQSADSVYIALEAGRLTVSASGVSLRNLIERIGSRAGFEVVAVAAFDTRIDSWSIADVPLKQAVEGLLKGTSAVVAYGPPESDSEFGGIAAVYLLGGRPNGQSAQVQSSADTAGRLITLAPTQSNQILLDETQLQDQEARIRSINRLAGLSDDITVDNLTFSLEFDPDPDVRKRAAQALADIGGEVAATALERGLGDGDASVRTQTVEFLAGIDDERITLWLGQMLMGDPDRAVKLAAAEALARRSDDMAAHFLQAAAGNESPQISEAATALPEPNQNSDR